MSEQAISIVQITDCHLEEQPNGELLGMDTDHSLQEVIKLVSAEQQPDLLLCTGDLSNKGSKAAYQRFKSYMETFDCPKYWLMGNHDHREHMQAVIGEGTELERTVDVGNWRIVLLDSSIPRKVEGKLAESELAFLQHSLSEAPQRHHLICLHHHVLAVGCAWLDQQRIANAAELLDLCRRYDNARALLSGHVHQHFEQLDDSMQILTTPSSCVQFATRSDDFKLDVLNPGYRWMRLHSDGRLETGISRVSEAITFKVNHNSKGY